MPGLHLPLRRSAGFQTCWIADFQVGLRNEAAAELETRDTAPTTRRGATQGGQKMIVPRSRLLWWVAFVVLPFAILGAVEPSATGVAMALIVSLLGIVLVDGFLAGRSLAGISLHLPEVARMSKDRDATIELRIRNERQIPLTFRLALALPREIHSAEEEMDVQLPKASEWSRLKWLCRPIKRGNCQLEASYVEVGSPLRFWGIRRRLTAKCEMRVYPNLLSERRNLAALFLNRGTFGIHARRQVGKGRDFEKLREYIPGDGYDEIHWKATAKRGHPVTKIFQIERTQEVYVIIDASRLSARTQISERSASLSPPNGERAGVRGTTTMLRPSLDPPPSETTVLERFVTAALVLGLAAEQQGDLFGLLTFTDKVGRFLRARNGTAHYNACRDALYTLQPEIVTPDFDDLCTFIRLRLRRRALLVFLTALDDPLLGSSFVRNMDLLCRQHLVFVNMIQPPGIVPMFSRPNVASHDDLITHLGGHLLWQNLREIERVLKRRGVTFSLIENERLSARLVSQYLSVKQRQLL